jgi:hypothetical protein
MFPINRDRIKRMNSIVAIFLGVEYVFEEKVKRKDE